MITTTTTYQVTCDRCKRSDTINYDPTSEYSPPNAALDWQFWGRIGWPTKQWMLCKMCSELIEKFFEGATVIHASR